MRSQDTTPRRILPRATASLRGLLALSAVSLTVGAVELPVYALQGGEDPALLPVLLDKRFGPGHRHQLSLMASTSMATKFVEGTGGLVTYGYSFNDMLGLELAAGGFVSGESSIMDQVRLNFPSGEPPLSDLYQMQAFGTANLILVPVYGKMSFASEFDPSFDLYLVAGVGAAKLRRQLGLEEKTYESKVGPVFDAGLGLRFYLTRLIALRFEFRDYFYPDPGEGVGGLTFNLQIQGGVQFAFGGAQ